jgi:hypothetical protein
MKTFKMIKRATAVSKAIQSTPVFEALEGRQLYSAAAPSAAVSAPIQTAQTIIANQAPAAVFGESTDNHTVSYTVKWAAATTWNDGNFEYDPDGDYEADCYDSNGNLIESVVVSGTTQATFTNLARNQDYTYTVQAEYGVGLPPDPVPVDPTPIDPDPVDPIEWPATAQPANNPQYIVAGDEQYEYLPYLGTKDFNTNDALKFNPQPANFKAGVDEAVAVDDTDVDGNPVFGDVMELYTESGPGAGSWVAQAAFNGEATFDASLTVVGSYMLGVSDDLDHTAISKSFTVSSGDPEQLVFSKQPSKTVEGKAISPAVTVSIEDQYGNVCTTDSSPISIFGPGITGTTTVNAEKGVATFSNLVPQMPGTFSMTATESAPGITPATSQSFTVTGQPSQLIFGAQTPHTVNPGTPFNVNVDVEDSMGNLVADTALTLTISNGTKTILTRTSPPTTNGIVTFTSLSIATPGSYTLTVTDGHQSSTFGSLTVTPIPTHLVIAANPAAGAPSTAGVPFGFVVDVEDVTNTIIAGDSDLVTFSILKGPVGGKLLGATTARATNGIATFSGLTLDVAGTYTLVAHDTVMGKTLTATFGPFNIAPNAVANFGIGHLPNSLVAGASLAPVAVTVKDSFGNLINGDLVTLTLHGPGGSTIYTGATVKGVATFKGITPTQTGTYYFTATDGSVTVASSNITVTPAAAAHVVIAPLPISATAGATIPSISVTVTDAFGNPVADNLNVSLSIASGPAGGALTGTATTKTSGGLATFGNISLKKAGAYVLKAVCGSASATSSPITINPAAVATLKITKQPPATAKAGIALATPITVEALDAYGNLVSNTPLSLSVASPATGTLSGALTATTSAGGIATFNNVTLNSAGSYVLSINDGGVKINTTAIHCLA